MKRYPRGYGAVDADLPAHSSSTAGQYSISSQLLEEVFVRGTTGGKWLLACSLASVMIAGCSSTVTPSGSQVETGSSDGVIVLSVPPMDATGSSGSFASLRSEADTTALPKKLMVYRVKPAGVTKDSFEARARKLGLTGSTEDLGASFQVVGPDASFEVDKLTGSFDYTTDALEKQTQPVRRLLPDAEYRQRAQAFLNSAGLMEEAAEFRGVNRGNVVHDFENGQWVAQPYMIEVRFSHKPLSGIAFDKGVGPKIVVQFGEDGQILGAMSVWRHVEPFAEYPLKSPQDALTAVRNGEAAFFDVHRQDSGVVKKISLSYMNEPRGYNQQYVLPVYLLDGVAAEGRSFVVVTRAIPDALLRVDP